MDTRHKTGDFVVDWKVLSIFIVYLIVSVFGILHHEMWRDELQAWLVARDASSLPELFSNLKYEGNPALWHLLLFGLSSITESCYSMQALHLAISFSFVFLFLTTTRFPYAIKVLFVLGYFVLYEYNLISRSYSLGVLLLFIVLVLLKDNRKHVLAICILLALLANTTIFGLIISSTLMLMFLVQQIWPAKEILFDRKGKVLKTPKAKTVSPEKPKLETKLLIGLVVFVLGAIASILQIYPEPDNTFPVSYPSPLFNTDRIYTFVPEAIGAFIPIPDFNDPHFWNSNFVDWGKMGGSPIFLLLLIVACTIIVFHSRNAVLFYLPATLVLIGFSYYTGLDWKRYTGHLFIVFIAALWLKNYFPEKKYIAGLASGLSRLGKKLNWPFLYTLLSLHVIGGVVAYTKDWKQTFAAGEKTAEYLKQHQLDSLPIVAHTDYVISPLSGFLNKPLYYPSRQEYGSFTIWNEKRIDRLMNDKLFVELGKVAETTRDSFVLVQSNPFTPEGSTRKFTNGNVNSKLAFRLVKSFEKDIVVENEDNHIYIIYIKDDLTQSVSEL